MDRDRIIRTYDEYWDAIKDTKLSLKKRLKWYKFFAKRAINKFLVSVRQFFCKHNYELVMRFSGCVSIWNPVEGLKTNDVKVKCQKCKKVVVNEPYLRLVKVLWTRTNSTYKYHDCNVPEELIIHGKIIKTGINDKPTKTTYKEDTREKPTFKVIQKPDLPEGVGMVVHLPAGWTDEQAKLIETIVNKNVKKEKDG